MYRKTLFLVSFLSILLGLSTDAQASPQGKGPLIIISVDVESNADVGLPEQLDAICDGGIPCGIQEVVSRLKRKGYQATFFLNVYEFKRYGLSSIKNIAAWLNESGQDIQLHTHPHWAYDARRKYMYEYTLREQIEIIKEGKELIKEWTGREVTAHRAGAYGADINTLRALVENGIYYDSSLFSGLKGCKINSLDLKKNVLSMFGPLYEFPVTVYQKNGFSPVLGTVLRPVSTIRKYDINWFGGQNEARKALDQAMVSNMDFIVLFLHSYSFITGRNSRGEPIADVDAIRTCEAVLDYINEKGLTVGTFRSLPEGKRPLSQYLGKPDVIPEVNIQIGMIKYLLKHSGINRNNYKVTIGLMGGAASAILFISITLFRRKRRLIL